MPQATQRDELMPYAVQPAEGRGRRLHAEPESLTRSPWQRDRDRVVHSSGFRRLQYKTQVFINHEGDFFRTRLTHSLEVAQVARSMARYLRLDEDLTEAVALAHDLGHTPLAMRGRTPLPNICCPMAGLTITHRPCGRSCCWSGATLRLMG